MIRFLTAILLLIMLTACGQPGVAALPIDKLKLPPGFQVSVYCDQVPNARQMALSDTGTLYVGSIGANTVYALPDRNHDYKVDEVVVLSNSLKAPNGVAFLNGDLFVGEVGRILKFPKIETQLKPMARSVVVYDKLPKDEWHGNRYIRFGPDGWLYVPVGAPCNVCERPDDARFASITRVRPDGSSPEIFAKGIRNTVGMDWDPRTKNLWFTDNGRDWLGDNLPPDELNCATSKGLHFGFPYRYGLSVPDPEFGVKAPKGLQFVPAAMPLGPHVASLGLRFYTGNMFPEKYRGNIFIAEHGSWNRSKKLGYRITMVTLENGKAKKYETFMDGFIAPGEGDAWGRPVDVCVMPDGSLLVSDDRCGAIYRITYSGRSK